MIPLRARWAWALPAESRRNMTIPYENCLIGTRGSRFFFSISLLITFPAEDIVHFCACTLIVFIQLSFSSLSLASYAWLV